MADIRTELIPGTHRYRILIDGDPVGREVCLEHNADFLVQWLVSVEGLAIVIEQPPPPEPTDEELARQYDAIQASYSAAARREMERIERSLRANGVSEAMLASMRKEWDR